MAININNLKTDTIEGFAVTCMLKGKSAKETLALVLKVFPSAKSTMKCMYHYSSKYKLGLGSKAKADQSELSKVLASL
jgi:hypothetical protein